MSKHNGIFLSLILVGTVHLASAQEPQVIDRVAAMVGSNIILESEIEMQYAQYLRNCWLSKPLSTRSK